MHARLTTGFRRDSLLLSLLPLTNPALAARLRAQEEREQGGTPDILAAVRCGLVFQLWASIGGQEIARRESVMLAKATTAWRHHGQISLLGDSGDPHGERVPIVSFMIKYGETGRWLHWNFVSILLSDLFGIQCRGGCLCAGPYGAPRRPAALPPDRFAPAQTSKQSPSAIDPGPFVPASTVFVFDSWRKKNRYGHQLLRIGTRAARLIEEELLAKNELLRPGYVRVSFG